MTSRNTLYRFYDTHDELLYIGISMTPWNRFAQHRQTKPWWDDIIRVQMEQYPDRSSLQAAERAAIIAERPKHNIVHNRGTAASPDPAPVLERVMPFQVDDWVGLGMRDGWCWVGEIQAVDDTWVAIQLKDFMDGGLDSRVVIVRWDEVQYAEAAYPELALVGEDMDMWNRAMKASRQMQDKHLGELQTAWHEAHDRDETPLYRARKRYRLENR